MPQVEMMEPKRPPKTTGNTLPGKTGHKRQNQTQAHDFLKELLDTLPNPSSPGSVQAKVKEDPGEENRPGSESMESHRAESSTLEDQSEAQEQKESFPTLLPDNTNLSSPIQSKWGGDQENEITLPVSCSFSGSADTIKPNESWESPATELPVLPVSEGLRAIKMVPTTPAGVIQGQTEEILKEKLAPDQGIFGDQGGLPEVLDQTTKGISPIEPDLEAMQRPSAPDLTSLMSLEGAGESPVNQEEKTTKLSLFQGEIFINSAQGEGGISFQSGSETPSGFEGFKEGNSPWNRVIPQENGPDQNAFPSFDLTNRLSWDSMGAGKPSAEYRGTGEYSMKPSESGFFKDPSFAVIHQSRTSMEITLEPAGLGKLDLQLNLNQDRLQGQILVHDNAGKELIEQNLPLLLSDLARGGLQIGGFTVSLKNQGQSHHPVPIRSEFEETNLNSVVPETIGSVQGNHLIHIII